MKGKLLLTTTNLSQSQPAGISSSATQIDSSTEFLRRLVTKWKYEGKFLGLIKQSTDISHLTLEERTCKCGCGLKFNVLPVSEQRYWSTECKNLSRGMKRHPQAHWRTGMSYMIRG